MANSWNKKDKRQFQHIADSMEKSGAREERAKEVAARTVNKQRRNEDRTPNRSTLGTGNPRTPLTERTKRELYNRARQLRIAGRGAMSKQELVEAIREH